jgi:solute carrier family 38 (sodium-coupled neutral amino acid transporter), member 11
MAIIVVTVVVEGVQVAPERRGDIKGYLFVNNGFFQAVGVISFGKSAHAFVAIGF